MVSSDFETKKTEILLYTLYMFRECDEPEVFRYILIDCIVEIQKQVFQNHDFPDGNGHSNSVFGEISELRQSGKLCGYNGNSGKNRVMVCLNSDFSVEELSKQLDRKTKRIIKNVVTRHIKHLQKTL